MKTTQVKRRVSDCADTRSQGLAVGDHRNTLQFAWPQRDAAVNKPPAVFSTAQARVRRAGLPISIFLHKDLGSYVRIWEVLILMRTELPQQATKWQWLPLRHPALPLTPHFPFLPTPLLPEGLCEAQGCAAEEKKASKDEGNTNKHEAIKRTMGDAVWCTFANK